MEEETEGLDRLIKQKKSRPNYARIISMEFSRGSNKDKSELNKKERRSVQNDATVGCSEGASPHVESDDSEYYSAEEEFLFSTSSSSVSTDDDSTETSMDQSSDSVFDSLQSSMNSHFSTSDSTEKLQSSSNTAVPERHRAPSKKQKRKRKKSGTVFSYNLPFCDLDIFDNELSDLKEVVVELDTNIFKPVPSLVELCMSASKKLAKTHSYINVPRSIRRILKIGNSVHSLQQQQLDYFFHILELARFSYNDIMKDYLVTLPSRNIWSIYNLKCDVEYVYQGNKTSSYLPYFYDYEWDPSVSINISKGLAACYQAKHLSVLAHTIDLMLPARLPGNKNIRRRHKSNTDTHLAEMDLNVKRVKQFLLNKFTGTINTPKDVKDKIFDDCVFDIVLPYVFWARGDVKQASQAFLSLVEKETRVRAKAQYLYEAGRMALQFGDSESAVRFYSLTSDALFTKPKHKEESLVQEVDRQTRMLCAASNDVGLLSFQKAERAFTAWTSAISVTIPASIQCGGPMSAMDSFLCYFAAYWHGSTGSIYEHAIQHLHTLAEKDKYLHFHLSMVYGLNGQGDLSAKMYRRFLARVTSDKPLPGSVTFNQTSKKPWQPIVDKVMEQGAPPIPMKVVWRMQLVPPRFSDPHHGNGDVYPHEADQRSRELNLRISNDGHLTGDMQMILPPMRGIYLDLYTGTLQLTKIPSNTEEWKTYQPYKMLCKDQYYSTYTTTGSVSFVPTMTQLYKGHFGETIHMLHANMFGNCASVMPEELNFNPNLCHLVWTGADGQKVKINVYHRLRWFIAERLQRLLKTNKHLSEEMKKEMEKLIVKFINKGWNFAIQNNEKDLCPALQRYATYNLSRKPAKDRKDDREGKEKKKREKRVQKPQIYFDCFSVVDCYAFNRGLVIVMKLEKIDYLMVLDTTSRETFMKPVFVKLPVLFQHFVKPPSTFQARSDCFCVYLCNHQFGTDGGYTVYDRYGEIINHKFITKFANSNGTEQIDPVTFHSTVYGLNENKLLFSNCNGFHSEMDYLGEMFGLGGVADVLVLLTTQGEVKFVDLPSQLPIEPVMALNKQLDPNVWDKDRLKIKDKIQFTSFKVVGEANFTDDSGKTYTRGAVSIDNNLLIIKVQRETVDDDAIVTVTQSIPLAGFPKEVHFINETVGFLVTATQHIRTDHHYRENLYHYHHDGTLKEVLLCLGQGPRSFLTVFLPANSDHEFADPDHGKEGWRVYMRDGHDGIICALLQ